MYKVISGVTMLAVIAAMVLVFNPFYAQAQVIELKDAEFTFIHYPIDEHPDRLRITGYLSPDFNNFGIGVSQRYQMPCDRSTDTVTDAITIVITADDSLGPVEVFTDTIAVNIPVSACSKKFRYNGEAFNSNYPDAEYDLRFEPRTNRIYLYFDLEEAFLFKPFTLPLGNSKADMASIACMNPPDECVINGCDAAPADPDGFFQCSKYLDFIRSISRFDIDIMVGSTTWSATNEPLKTNMETCCQNVNKQELELK